MSRHPCQYAETASLALSDEEDECASIIVGIGHEAEAFFAITWQRVKLFSGEDTTLQFLSKIIMSGFPATKKELPVGVQPFWEVRDHLMYMMESSCTRIA